MRFKNLAKSEILYLTPDKLKLQKFENCIFQGEEITLGPGFAFMDEPIFHTDDSSPFDMSFFLTDCYITYKGEYGRIGINMAENVFGYIAYNMIFISETGRAGQLGSIEFSRSGEEFVAPEGFAVFSGKKTVGDGIYLLYLQPYSGESYVGIREYSSADDRWSVINDSDIYKPVVLEYGRGESYHFAVPEGETITGISFEFAVGEVKIQTGKTMELAVTDMFENAISASVRGGVWYITDSLLDSGSVHSDYSPDITITLPADAVFEQAEIYLAAGLLSADELMAKEMNLEVDAGSLKIFELVAENSLVVKNGVGEVKVYDAKAKDLSIDNGIGAITLDGAISGHNEVKCGIGEVKLSLTDRRTVDFNYKVECGIGEVEIGDMVLHGDYKNTSYDQAETDYFEVDCGIGHVEIKMTGH